jgi:hypothetical protein
MTMVAREAVTIRFPEEVLDRARATKGEESFNEYVVDAVDREARRRQGLSVYNEILRIREEIEKESGIQPDSRPLIRELRDGIGHLD